MILCICTWLTVALWSLNPRFDAFRNAPSLYIG